MTQTQVQRKLEATLQQLATVETEAEAARENLAAFEAHVPTLKAALEKEGSETLRLGAENARLAGENKALAADLAAERAALEFSRSQVASVDADAIAASGALAEVLDFYSHRRKQHMIS